MTESNAERVSTDVTTGDFREQVLGAKEPVIVDFWAGWCAPCRAVGPILEQIASEHPNVKLVKVDVDAEQALALEYGITSIPAMKVFQDGKVVKELVGARPKRALEAELSEFLV